MATLANTEIPSTAYWTEQVGKVLARYDAALLRKVADRLLRSRLKRSPEELIEKITEALTNAAAIDRRLGDLEPPQRGLLALVGMSRQPVWRLGSLLELLSVFDVPDNMAAVFGLFEAGLLCPALPAEGAKLKSFEEWLGRASATEFRVIAPPGVTTRALAEPVSLPPVKGTVKSVKDAREADGLECFLRLGILWQQVKALPLRLTQQGEFFKRDQERLSDGLLVGPPAEEVAPLPDWGHLLVGLGVGIGLLGQEPGQIEAAAFPAVWEEGLGPALTGLWAAMPEVRSWDAAEGWRGAGAAPSPYVSAGLLALALLAQLSESEWATPHAVADWLAEHHCYWKKPADDDGETETLTPPSLQSWAEGFLLGLAFQLKLTQAAKDAKGRAVVRLSGPGRHVLGLGPPPALAEFPRTLLVQPNMELVAYRQGMQPALAGKLSRLCTWKNIGAACTLQIQPESVYRGLEAGLALEDMLQLLEKHGVRETPAGVLQTLRTWADKRERISVYAAATLLEFTSPDELQAALNRGLPAVRIADRLALVAREGDIDFSHFRLLTTRDYGLPPEKCVEVGSDGVTLTIDLARADLMLETELQRFADAVPEASRDGRRVYRLTPGSLGRGREAGLALRTLDEWFQQRVGRSVTPAARLLSCGMVSDHAAPPSAPATVQRLLVVQVPSEEIADGLAQWPATRALIQSRLGPTALVVEEADLEAFRRLLSELRLALNE